MKAIYRHRASGDVFAIETDDAGNVISTSGPLFGDGFDPAKLGDFERMDETDRTNGTYRTNMDVSIVKNQTA